MHCHCCTNIRVPRWTFTEPCKPEVRPGAKEEYASPAWLAAPAMNARDITKVYIWRLDTGCGPIHYVGSFTATTPGKGHNNTWVEPLAGNCTTSSTRQREQVWQKCKIQKNWCTVTVAPTIEHHDGHSRTPANQRWDRVPGRRTICFISISAAVHRPTIGWQSGDILGSIDHRSMIGRPVADGKSWMYMYITLLCKHFILNRLSYATL